MRRHVLTTAMCLVAAWLCAAGSADAAGRFDREMRAFARADRQKVPRAGVILFTGSSSIRMWRTLQRDMEGMDVVNRGFGGSMISDVLHSYDRVVTPHKPSMIVLYCGENDITAGKSPQKVFGDFKTFVNRVQKDFPKTRIIYISMKPSPSRWHLWPKFVEGNELIRRHCASAKKLWYIDISKCMLGPDGRPLRAIWLNDNLHMNDTGYMLWTSAVRRAIDQQRSRWADTISRFDMRDIRWPSPAGVTVFTGSSSIAMWGGNLKKDLHPRPVINRGFGGSQISDVLCFFDEIVEPHDPNAVVLYCGENDITAGKSPQRVADDFKEFVRRVRDAKPHVPVFFISMKPSPSRWRLWDKFVIGNKMIEEFCSRSNELHYIDVGAGMLGADGKPKPEIWLNDKLHMNRTGYAIWTELVGGSLDAELRRGKR